MPPRLEEELGVLAEIAESQPGHARLPRPEQRAGPLARHGDRVLPGLALDHLVAGLDLGAHDIGALSRGDAVADELVRGLDPARAGEQLRRDRRAAGWQLVEHGHVEIAV